MVKTYNIEYLYRQINPGGTEVIPDERAIQDAIALLHMKSRRPADAVLEVFARIAFPYYIVQWSSNESILVSGFDKHVVSFEIPVYKGLQNIKNTIASMNRDNVIEILKQVKTTFEKSQSETIEIKGLVMPDIIPKMRGILKELEPGKFDNEIKINFTSDAALDTSSSMQKLVKDLETQSKNIDELNSMLKSKVEDILKVVDNLINTEKSKMGRQAQSLEETIEMEIQRLEQKASDRKYELKNKKEAELKKLNTELAKAIFELEQFYTNIADLVRQYRGEITDQMDNFKAGKKTFEKMVSEVTEKEKGSQEIIERLEKFVRELYEKNDKIIEEYEAEISRIDEALKEQIIQQKHRRVEYDLQVQETLNRLLDERDEIAKIFAETTENIQNAYNNIRSKLTEIYEYSINQNEFGITVPISKVQIITYGGKYKSTNKIELATPAIIPEQVKQPLKLIDFEKCKLKEMISEYLNDSSLRNIIESAMKSYNMLNDDGLNNIKEGIKALVARRTIDSDLGDRLIEFFESSKTT